jgi:hypothetical protein
MQRQLASLIRQVRAFDAVLTAELLHKPAGQGCSPHFEAVHGNAAETV